nr:CHASE3 domain-containing protein [Zongyanglinia huanghaiensis]
MKRFRFTDLKTKQKIIAVTLVPLALFMAIGVFIMTNLTQMEVKSGWVEHTQKVLGQSNAIVASAVDMETGLRGYLLAGREEFLEPYNAGQDSAYQALAELAVTVSDNPPQVDRLNEAADVLKEWQVNVADPMIALRRAIGDAPSMNDMAIEIRKAKGKTYFDEFRRVIAAFMGAENDLLAERQAVSAEVMSTEFVAASDVKEAVSQVEEASLILHQAQDLLASAIDMETGARGFYLAGDEAFLEPYNVGQEAFKNILTELKSAVEGYPDQLARLDEIETIIDTWRAEVVVPDIALRNQIGDAKTMDDMADLVGEGNGKKYFDGFRAIMAAFHAEEQALMTTRQAENNQTSSSTRTMIPIAIAAAIALSTVVSLLIGSKIGRAIKILTNSMRDLADGDNSVRVQGQRRGDEIGQMARALEVFRESRIALEEAERKAEDKQTEQNAVVHTLSERLSRLAEGELDIQIQERFPEDYECLRQDFNGSVSTLQAIVERVGDTTGSIRNGAEEISQASDDLSHRTESQAATLEQTAAALDELTASVKSSADGARSVEATMNKAGDEARDSGKVVQNAVSAMTEIEESSRHISQIISVIDDIAFQTNLLALNAGVEAARAGEAGRGFAVVASEVRALAQRSSDAAMEIKTLIGDSTEQVERGVDLVGRAGTALQSIVEQVGEITKQVAGIAEGASEQSIGLNEINSGMIQLDEVTQKNAAMVEESTAASHLLKADTSKLTELMSHFGLSHRATSFGGTPELAPTAHGSGGDLDDWSDEASSSAPMAATGTDPQAQWQDF